MGQAEKARLLEQVKELQVLAQELAAEKEWEEIVHFIHQPGWTTPAESRLTHTIAESMVAQMRELIIVREGFLAGAGEIVGEKAGVAG
jgi:hypothetical protein